MATQIPIHYQDLYTANYRHLVQQKATLLRDRVMVDFFKGKSKQYPFLGKMSMRAVTARTASTSYVDPTMPKRWVRPTMWDVANIIDENDDDLLGTLGSPQNAFVQSHGAAAGRQLDSLIISAAVGTAYEGEQGTTAVTLPAGQQIAANYGGSSIGLTLAKLIQAKYIMDAAMVPDENRYIAYGAKQLADLLNNVSQVSSADYSNVKALIEGKVNNFLGFTFVRVDASLLPYNSGTDVRTAVAFQKDGVVLGVVDDFKSTIDRIPNQNNAVQVRSTLLADAARLEDTHVVSIACDESP